MTALVRSFVWLGGGILQYNVGNNTRRFFRRTSTHVFDGHVICYTYPMHNNVCSILRVWENLILTCAHVYQKIRANKQRASMTRGEVTTPIYAVDSARWSHARKVHTRKCPSPQYTHVNAYCICAHDICAFATDFVGFLLTSYIYMYTVDT